MHMFLSKYGQQTGWEVQGAYHPSHNNENILVRIWCDVHDISLSSVSCTKFGDQIYYMVDLFVKI